MAPALLRSQPLWISAAVLILCIAMSLGSEAFATHDNFFNVTRNFAFIGLIALGQTAVIITAGIDLSVGSVMGLSGVVAALALQAGQPLWLGVASGLGVALACGAVNGVLIAYVRLSPFVVTLGMLAIARSLALAVSDNRMVYEFGPDEDLFLALGGGQLLGVANPVWILLVAALLIGFFFRFTRWGRHLYATGGNEQAARLAGVPVDRIKLSAYLLCSGLAGLSAVLTVGWLGAVTNALRPDLRAPRDRLRRHRRRQPHGRRRRRPRRPRRRRPHRSHPQQPPPGRRRPLLARHLRRRLHHPSPPPPPPPHQRLTLNSPRGESHAASRA